MFAFATKDEEQHLLAKKKHVGTESYSVYAMRVITSLNYYLSMYFITLMNNERVKVPRQLQGRIAKVFSKKMLVSNIGTYKQLLKTFELNKEIGNKFRNTLNESSNKDKLEEHADV